MDHPIPIFSACSSLHVDHCRSTDCVCCSATVVLGPSKRISVSSVPRGSSSYKIPDGASMLGLGTRAVSRLQRRCRCLALRFDTGPNSQLSTCGNGRHTRTSLYSEPPPQVTSNRAEPKTPGSTPTPVHSTPAQLNSAQHSQRSPRSPRRTVALLHCCTHSESIGPSPAT